MTNELERLNLTIIPAHPGWEMIGCYDADDDNPESITIDHLYRVAIIAWQVQVFQEVPGPSKLERSVDPVMVEELWNNSDDMVLEDPAGRMCAIDDRDFANLEEVVEWFKEKKASAIRRAAARKKA